MTSRVGFIQKRIAVNLAQSGTDVPVMWANVAGATTDAGTGAAVGGTQEYLSGVMRAFGHAEPASSYVRRFAEVQAGDLILDLAPNPLVKIFPGQSLNGCIALDALPDQDIKFSWNGVWHEQAKVGAELAAIWDATMAGHRLHRTLLLRRAN